MDSAEEAWKHSSLSGGRSIESSSPVYRCSKGVGYSLHGAGTHRLDSSARIPHPHPPPNPPLRCHRRFGRSPLRPYLWLGCSERRQQENREWYIDALAGRPRVCTDNRPSHRQSDTTSKISLVHPRCPDSSCSLHTALTSDLSNCQHQVGPDSPLWDVAALPRRHIT